MGKDEEAEFEEELDLNADVNDDDDDLMLDEDSKDGGVNLVFAFKLLIKMKFQILMKQKF